MGNLPIVRVTLIVSGHKSWNAGSVWSKTTLITGGVVGAGAGPPICKIGIFFQIPFALVMPIGNNFQLNGASEQSLKLWLLQ